MTIVLTDGTERDHAFVATSWVQSYGASPSNRYMRRGRYVAGHRRVMAHLLQTAHLLVARPDGDWRDGIAGYVLWSPAVGGEGAIHWWLVKKPWRRQGIGRGLLEGALAGIGHPKVPAVFTHMPHHHKDSRPAEALWRREVYYDPYWLVRASEESAA